MKSKHRDRKLPKIKRQAVRLSEALERCRQMFIMNQSLVADNERLRKRLKGK